MKHFMPGLISKIQSTFVENRNISNNILLAQELVKGYGRKFLFSRCAIKVDLRKAFDSINWDFLFKVLEAMNFPSQFVHWIKGCISGSRFSLMINGGLIGYFRGKKD